MPIPKTTSSFCRRLIAEVVIASVSFVGPVAAAEPAEPTGAVIGTQVWDCWSPDRALLAKVTLHRVRLGLHIPPEGCGYRIAEGTQISAQVFRVTDGKEELLWEAGPSVALHDQFGQVNVLFDNQARGLVALVDAVLADNEDGPAMVILGPKGVTRVLSAGGALGVTGEQIRELTGTGWAQWRESRVPVTVTDGKRSVLGIWTAFLPGDPRARWRCFDMQDGVEVYPDETLTDAIQAAGRQWSREILVNDLAEWMPHTLHQRAAVEFLGALRNTEDRAAIEDELRTGKVGILVRRGPARRGSAIEKIALEGRSRRVAARVLAEWDGLTGQEAGKSTGHFLGAWRATMHLPPDLPEGPHRMWLRLCEGKEPDIGAAIQQRPVGAVSLNENDSGASCRLEWSDLPPGTYYVMVRLEVDAPEGSGTGLPPDVGDYIAVSDVFEIVAGQAVDAGVFRCDTLVTKEMAAEWAQGPQTPQQEAEDSDNAP